MKNEHIQHFLQSVEAVGQQLRKFSSDIENREQQIQQILLSMKEFSSRLTLSEEQNEFTEVIKSTIEAFQIKIERWVSLIEQHIEGKDFINQFEKSVILTVFGNVNAGKSSLGNFIAGIPDEIKEHYVDVPDFYIYDLNESKQQQKGPNLLPEKGFKEGCIETTSSIQYFTLQNGLTWVDTPGVHSINQSNEELAKKYVDFSDLVLFMVPSTSPGKADEIEELEKLIQKKKSLLVTITKSDQRYEDEIDGQIVIVEAPKNQETRKQQEAYIAGVLEQKGIHSFIKDASFVSISPLIARKALREEDHVLFEQSGLPAFYQQISKVLTQNAIELKQDRPKQQINAAIQELKNGFESNQERIEGLSEIIQLFMDISQQLQEKRQALLQIQADLLTEIKAVSMFEIDSELKKLSFQFDSGTQINSKQISRLVESSVISNYYKLAPTKFAKVLRDIQLGQLQTLNIALDVDFQGKYETVTYNEYFVKDGYRDPQGIIEHISSLFGKKFKTSKMRSREVDVQVKVGNNYNEVIEGVYASLDTIIQQLLASSISEIEEKYFVANNEILSIIINKLQETDKKLSDLLL